MVGGRIAGQALGGIASVLAKHTETAVYEVVRNRSGAIRVAVDYERLRNPHMPPKELADLLARRRTLYAAASGAATAAPSAVPGTGTVIALTMGIADSIQIVYSEVTLICAIAQAYDRSLRDREARTLDVLSVLALDAGAASFKRGELRIGDHTLRPGRDQLPPEAIADINRHIIGYVTRRVGRHRARQLLGRSVPLGVGIVVGGSVNYRAMRRITRNSVRLFEAG